MQTILGGSFTIKSAINGREAFEIMNTFTPDLIISDVQMAEMDGLTFSSKIKGNFETSHIPIILLSALSQKDQILQGIQVGVDDYITKPFDIDLLIAKIHAILKNRELVRARFLSKLDDNKVVDVKTEIPNERDREFIEKALTLIQHNLSDYNFNKDILAREMAVSQSLLYSKIKHLSGEAPSDLIRIIRLKKSMELLKMNQYPISDVAFMCGFNDAKYFSTVFKKYFGKSPSEIKK
jgi:YesN/AraC family two-component response regulator